MMAPGEDERLWSVALIVFLSHWCFSVIIMIENFFLYFYCIVLPGSNQALLYARQFFMCLPFLQIEHIAVALGCGLIGGALWRWAVTRWGFLLCFTALNAYLVLNQIGYRIFFTHLHPGATGGQVRLSTLEALAGSALAEADWLTVLNIPLILLATVASGSPRLRTWLAGRFSRLTSRERPHPLLVGGGWGYLGGMLFFAIIIETNHNLERHPVLNLLVSPPDVNVVLSETALPAELPQRLVFGQSQESDQTKAALQRAQAEIRATHSRANVILIVLESIGTKQIFRPDRQGGLDPQLVPNLARLSQNSVVFDSIYTTFPATTHAHVPLMTGGRTITWGNVFQELSAPYSGSTLPRVFKQGGYHTGFVSSSDTTFANLGPYLRSTGFDYFFGAYQLSPDERAQSALNSWGVVEEVMLARTLHWLDTISAAERPFLLQWLTLATHHPYSTPADYPAPFGEGERRSRYWNALHYTDAMVGRLIDALAERSLLEDTLILVTGDHGEGFGQWHEGNFIHGAHLYEESVKTFLMVSTPGTHHAPSPPLIVHRIGSLGDILPTVLALTGMSAAAVPGQDLFSPAYTPQPVFFQNTHLPKRWGLRDGQWKFIAPISGTEVELYDLEADPDEQVNIADIYPEKIQRYRQLCTQWHLTSNADYVALLR